jgi:hypothetical protein
MPGVDLGFRGACSGANHGVCVFTWAVLSVLQFVRLVGQWFLVGCACSVNSSLYFIIEIHKGLTMIRLSQLFNLGVKSRGAKEVNSTIYFGIFAINEPCHRQVTNRRYATAPQGNNFYIYIYFCISFRMKVLGICCQSCRLGWDEELFRKHVAARVRDRSTSSDYRS